MPIGKSHGTQYNSLRTGCKSEVRLILCSMVYIAAEADHDCVGDGCAICAQISICRNTLKDLMTAVCAAVFAAAFIYILCRIASVCTDSVQFSSLVSLKVKLSD